MSKLYLFVLYLFVSLAVVSCGSKEKPVLRIGMNVEFPPFASIVDSAYVGVDVDLSHKIAQKLEMPYEIINMEFDTLIQALKSDKIDIIISAMSITDLRSRQVEFTQPYYLAHLVLIAGEKSPQMPVDEKDIGKYKIGVLHGSTAHEYLLRGFVDKDILPSNNLVLYAQNTEAIEALIAGEIDFVVNDSSAAKGFGQTYPVRIGLQLNTKEEYAIAMPRDGKYNEKINNALQDIIDSGELNSILATHIAE